MQSYVRLWWLTEFYLEWEMFQTNVVEKNQTHVLYSVMFVQKSSRFCDNVEKFGRAR